MILADHQIRQKCDPLRFKYPLVSPFKPEHLQPSSVDLTLDELFLALKRSTLPLDLTDISVGTQYDAFYGDYTLYPQEFVLGATQERVQIPSNMVGRVEGKSSLGRLGLLVHSTAGYIDPGFHGTVTLELFNLNHRPIILRGGLPICQVSFTELSAPAEKPYGHRDLKSKYQDQTETTASQYAA